MGFSSQTPKLLRNTRGVQQLWNCILVNGGKMLLFGAKMEFYKVKWAKVWIEFLHQWSLTVTGWYDFVKFPVVPTAILSSSLPHRICVGSGPHVQKNHSAGPHPPSHILLHQSNQWEPNIDRDSGTASDNKWGPSSTPVSGNYSSDTWF